MLLARREIVWKKFPAVLPAPGCVSHFPLSAAGRAAAHLVPFQPAAASTVSGWETHFKGVFALSSSRWDPPRPKELRFCLSRLPVKLWSQNKTRGDGITPLAAGSQLVSSSLGSRGDKGMERLDYMKPL